MFVHAFLSLHSYVVVAPSRLTIILLARLIAIMLLLSFSLFLSLYVVVAPSRLTLMLLPRLIAIMLLLSFSLFLSLCLSYPFSLFSLFSLLSLFSFSPRSLSLSLSLSFCSRVKGVFYAAIPLTNYIVIPILLWPPFPCVLKPPQGTNKALTDPPTI